jgi:polar amino acid transport system substrate-binding protein
MSSLFSQLWKIVIICIIAAMLTFAVGIKFLVRDRSLTEMQKSGVIRIGYAIEAPYAFLGKNGEPTGESPEIARHIAKELGFSRIEWVQTEFGSLLTGLKDKRFDVVAAGMFVTSARANMAAFSEPTFKVEPALLVSKGNPDRIHSYEQAFALPDLVMAVIFGSVEENLCSSIGFAGRRLIRVPDALTGRIAVETATAGALALSAPTLRWMTMKGQMGKTEMAEPFTPPPLYKKQHLGFGAFAFRKEDQKLVAAWNRKLKEFIGTPEHLKLVSSFGFGASDLPGSMTTQEIIGGL